MSARLAAMVGAVLLIGSAIPDVAAAGRDQVRIPVRHDREADATELLVRYRDGTSSSRRRDVRAAHGLVQARPTRSRTTEVYGTSGRSIAALRATLLADPSVVLVAPNFQRVLTDAPITDPGFAHLWGLDNRGQTVGPSGHRTTGTPGVDIDGPDAFQVTKGDPGVIVAVIDDGVDFSHPDLADRAWSNPGETGLDDNGDPRATNGIDDDGNGYIDDVHGWDFCNDDNTVHDPGHDGHGTHVAGTIAASLDGQGVVGVAPGVTIMALKFIDSVPGCGRDDMAIDAIEYAASFGVRIANASWGGEGFSPVLDAAIGASGMLFVAAAGNGDRFTGLGYDIGVRAFHPAGSNQPNVLTVAAADPTGKLASFSNYSTTGVDIAAPGVNVLSAYPAVPGTCSVCWAWSDGTSMAAPHVSGVAALIGSIAPSLLADPAALRARILATGSALPKTVGRTATGAMVNAWHALDSVAPTTAAPSGHRFVLGSRVERTTAKVKVSWPAGSDDLTGIGSYLVQQRAGSVTWTTLSSKATSTSITRDVTFGKAYAVRVRASDRAGNAGAFATGPTLTTHLHQETAKAVRFSASWRISTAAGASGGRTLFATRKGAAVTYTFTGRAVAVVAPKGPTRGSVDVYVDGVKVKTVNLYRASTAHRLVIHESHWATSGKHSIRLVVVGTKGRPRVDIDGFLVLR
jgi:subtilisin family serine protease